MLMQKSRLQTDRGKEVLALQLEAWTFESHFWDADAADAVTNPTCMWCGYTYKRRPDGLLKGAPMCIKNPLIEEILNRRSQDGI